RAAGARGARRTTAALAHAAGARGCAADYGNHCRQSRLERHRCPGAARAAGKDIVMSESDRALHLTVHRLRRGLRNRLLLEGGAKVLAAALLALGAGSVLTAIFGAGSNAVVTIRVVGYVLIAAALVRYLLVPLFARHDAARLALYAEEQAPELKQ